MMRNVIKPLVASFLASATLLLSGCASITREYTVIDGEKIEFASEYESEKWREPLEKLLSNTFGKEFYDDATGTIVIEEAPYPERPSVERGYGCALYDLNFDGTPELLVNMGGGSAGNIPYMVYDIYTGENVGSLESSPGDCVCSYYDLQAREVKVINQSYWRSGWSSKLFFTYVITPDGEGGFCEESYLQCGYDMSLSDSYSIVCTGMHCRIWGKTAEPEFYLAECDEFEKNYIRINETGLKYVAWYNVEKKGDTPDERGEKMAAALLSSGQKFVVYDG